MRFQPLPILTAVTVVSVIILIIFGNWQWGRYQEKMAGRGSTPDWAEITGTPIPGTEQAVYAYTEGRAAWRDVIAFDTADGVLILPRRIRFEVEPPELVPTVPAETLTLRGLWHPLPRRNAFAAEDQPQFGIYYTFDPVRLAEALHPEIGARLIPRVFEPETLLLADTGTSVPNPMLQPGDSERLPPERHFGYAITWWGLAMALIGVYLAFHHQRGQLRFRRETE